MYEGPQVPMKAAFYCTCIRGIVSRDGALHIHINVNNKTLWILPLVSKRTNLVKLLYNINYIMQKFEH